MKKANERNKSSNSKEKKKYSIYILQMYSKTVPSKLIKKFTRYEYTHVALSLEKNCETIYSFGRKKINSILNAGFVIEGKESEFYKKFNDTRCRIYELKINQKQYNKILKIIKYMEKHQNKYKYDFKGIILRYFNIPVRYRDKYVCSYFVADVIKRASIYEFEKQTIFIKPEDIEKMKGLQEIYRGNYVEYKNKQLKFNT